MASDIQLIQSLVTSFHTVMLSARPFYPVSTQLIKIVLALIESETTKDEKHLKRVTWIYENTHEKVNEHLSIVEFAVFRNINGKLNRTLEINNKEFYLTELYRYIDDVIKELHMIVIEIAKKYSLEIPFNLKPQQTVTLT